MDWSLSRRWVLGCLVLVGVANASAEPTTPAKPLPAGTIQVTVEDLHCKTCAKKAARKLYAIKGVQKVSWNLKADRLTVVSPATKSVGPLACWDAVIAGGLKPTVLRQSADVLGPEAIEALRRQARSVTATRR